MGFAGLIFVVVAMWLVYLVPLVLQRRVNGLFDEVEPGEPFSASVTIVRRGTPLDSAEEAIAVVSTPLNRRAALAELAHLDRRAAARRRNVLGVLALATLTVGLLVGFGQLAWWAILIPVALIGAFLALARFTVARMRADLDRRAALVRSGDQGAQEETVAISVLEAEDLEEHEASVDLTAPLEAAASLWDPVPITQPTYVQKPLAPRTVRTIDLSAPVPAADPLPVTADAPEPDASEPDQDRRAG